MATASNSRSSYDTISTMPLPLRQAIRELPGQYLKVLTKPSIRTFVEEKGKASWSIVWIQLISLSIISAVLIAINYLIYPPHEGRYLEQIYTTLLFGVPLVIVSYLLLLIPVAGSWLTYVPHIYSVVLLILSLIAVHRQVEESKLPFSSPH